MVPIVAALLNAGLGILGNAVATHGKDFIEEKIGVDITKLLGSEEGRVKLAQVQASNEEALLALAIKKKEVEISEIKLDHANTDSARKMQQAALQQDDLFSKRFSYWLATGWSSFSILYLGLITFMDIPAANIRFVDTVLGFILGTIIATIINYFYGSSKQSHAKDATIAEAVKGAHING